jgi:hypothetical protein
MEYNRLAKLTHGLLCSLGVKDVRIDRDLDSDKFVCRVTFVVDAQDELGVFSALHTVVAAINAHLVDKVKGTKHD